MSQEIDWVSLDVTSPEYPYSLEAFDENKPCGGCRTKTKDDLKEMYRRWQERYSGLFLKYYFKRNERLIEL